MSPRSARNLALGALFALALLVRLAWVPTWSRLSFDGQERLYLRAFQGQVPDPTPRAWPALCWLYRAMGLLFQDGRALVVLSAAAGAAAVVGAAVWTGRRYGPLAGAWAGILVALFGEHAAWSTSAYNVILPDALVIWAFVMPGWPAALLVALATLFRPDVAVVAPFLGRSGLGAIAGLAELAWVGAPPAGPLLLSLRANLPMVRFLGPPVLLVGLLGLAHRRAWRLLGLAAWVHLTGSLFDDYGTRHALLGGVALCALAGVAAARWGGLLGLVVAVGLARDTANIAHRWYAWDPPPADGLPSGLPPGCTEVSAEPPIPGQPLPSHFAFLSGELHGCVVWGEEAWHRQWSSRGLADRALRMRTLYRLVPVAAVAVPGGVRRYYRLERR